MKFKVGDKVKCVETIFYNFIELGCLYKVKASERGGIQIENIDNNTTLDGWYDECCFKLVDENITSYRRAYETGKNLENTLKQALKEKNKSDLKQKLEDLDSLVDSAIENVLEAKMTACAVDLGQVTELLSCILRDID